jgi:hypothetical protein
MAAVKRKVIRPTVNDSPNCKDEKEKAMKTIYFASVCDATLLVWQSPASQTHKERALDQTRIRASRPSNAGM